MSDIGQPDKTADAGNQLSAERPSWNPVSADLTITRRDLPHWQIGGATYFITFRIKGYSGTNIHPVDSSPSGTDIHPMDPSPSGTGFQPVNPRPSPLTPPERTIVKNAILFWQGKKWAVDALTVMPDHVHILATPLEKSPGAWFSLSELMHSIKSFTSNEIQRLRGVSGVFWQSERFDRVNRNEREFHQKANYILENAQRKELVHNGWDYEWFWCPAKDDP